MDVGDWLRRLGLGEYERAFRDHRIDFDILSGLKHSHCQDVAYGALLRDRHTEQSGDVEKAAVMWERAGRLALERSELAEAAAQLQRALALIESVPASPLADALRRTVKAQLAALRASARGRAGLTLRDPCSTGFPDT